MVYVVLAGAGAALFWLLRAMLRGRRSGRADVSPLSEHWLAEKRAKED
jgi:hypothetical protein